MAKASYSIPLKLVFFLCENILVSWKRVLSNESLKKKKLEKRESARASMILYKSDCKLFQALSMAMSEKRGSAKDYSSFQRSDCETISSFHSAFPSLPRLA